MSNFCFLKITLTFICQISRTSQYLKRVIENKISKTVGWQVLFCCLRRLDTPYTSTVFIVWPSCSSVMKCYEFDPFYYILCCYLSEVPDLFAGLYSVTTIIYPLSNYCKISWVLGDKVYVVLCCVITPSLLCIIYPVISIICYLSCHYWLLLQTIIYPLPVLLYSSYCPWSLHIYNTIHLLLYIIHCCWLSLNIISCYLNTFLPISYSFCYYHLLLIPVTVVIFLFLLRYLSTAAIWTTTFDLYLINYVVICDIIASMSALANSIRALARRRGEMPAWVADKWP